MYSPDRRQKSRIQVAGLSRKHAAECRRHRPDMISGARDVGPNKEV
jgi:hypothetical protein